MDPAAKHVCLDEDSNHIETYFGIAQTYYSAQGSQHDLVAMVGHETATTEQIYVGLTRLW